MERRKTIISQLEIAATIKSYRQLGLSIEEIKAVFAGADVKEILLSSGELRAGETSF